MKYTRLIVAVAFLVSLPVYAHYHYKVGDAGPDDSTIYCVGDTPDVTKCSTSTKTVGKIAWFVSNKDLAYLDTTTKMDTRVSWSTYITSMLVGASSKEDGKINTDKIVNKLGVDGTAAYLCRSYGGGKNKAWSLPSVEELKKLQQFAREYSLIEGSEVQDFMQLFKGMQCFHNDDSVKDFKGPHYWSSTEEWYPESAYYVPFFYYSSWGSNKKSELKSVRATCRSDYYKEQQKEEEKK